MSRLDPLPHEDTMILTSDAVDHLSSLRGSDLLDAIRHLCKVAEEREELFPIYSCEGWAWRVLMEPEEVDDE